MPKDEQIIVRLAKFCGWGITGTWKLGDKTIPKWEEDGKIGVFSEPPYFLQSLDALRPVLEKLSEEQWRKTHDKLWMRWFDISCESPQTMEGRSCVYFLLTLSPARLALALYEVIGDTDASP